jgi:hypothetical protein
MPYHLPIDDLESFIWVLIFRILFMYDEASVTKDEIFWWNGLSGSQPVTMWAAKDEMANYFLSHLIVRDPPLPPADPPLTIGPRMTKHFRLFQSLFAIISKAMTDTRPLRNLDTG